jgi:tetratricopeptide (TPR) repeat protein
MSLLIDALKRAERAKSGQTEPPAGQGHTIERAIEAQAKPGDWALAEPAPEPAAGEVTADPALPRSRTEPTFSLAASDPPPIAPAKTAGTHDKEREAAQTLFQAKHPAPRSRAGILLAGGVATLLLAGGAFYVWYSLAFPPSPPMQTAQARVAAPLAPSPREPAPVAPIARAAPEKPVEPPAVTPIEATPKVAEKSTLQNMVEKPRNSKRSPQRIAAQSNDDVEPIAAKESATEDTVRREIEEARRSRVSKSRRPAKNDRAISVSRGDRAGTDFDPDLTLAYNSLLSGQRAEAKRLYSIVLERDPFSVDALLGLATIAANQSDVNGAERLYQQALELEPQNAAALAGVASLRQPGGPSESQIKFELARTPDSAQLHFALGNQYANQGRWDEAQQAYFDAFGLDATNPDYAYNLAVSLDQLGQIKPAATYYRKSLDLAKKQSARFRSADVESRLSELAAVR